MGAKGKLPTTIRMPCELGEKWLAALRSGEYKQGRGALYNAGTKGYCCLGVLLSVAGETNEALATHNWPNLEDMRKYGIEFRSSGGELCVCKGDPFLPSLGLPATLANDGYGGTGAENSFLAYPFPEIADAIEQCMEYTDK